MDDKAKTNRAQSIVRRYMLMSLGLGAVPLPLVDMAILSGLQLKMLERLSSLYEVPFSARAGRETIASLVGSVSAVSIGRFFLPGGGLGTVVSMSAFAGASTYGLGQVFIQDFESGGAFLSMDPEKVREKYKEEVERGKQAVRESFVSVRP